MLKIKQQHGLDQISPYVPGKPIEEVKRELGIEDVIKLASNENPLGASPMAQKAVENMLQETYLYPDGESYSLRKALAEKYNLAIEQVVTGNGADGVIMSLCMAYLDEKDEVIVSQSSFPVYDIFTNVMRGKLIKTPLLDFGLNLHAMLDAITEKTKIIFVCNPNNPTSTIVKADEVERFVKKVPDKVIVVFDEAYFEFVDDPDFPDTLPYVRNHVDNVMVMRTFSKVNGLAGLRIGYAFGTPELLAPMNVVKGPFSVNLLAQVAGVAALKDEDFIKQTVYENRQNREWLYQAYEHLGLFFVKSQTNFIMVKFGPKADVVNQELLKAGIIIRPCKAYGLPEYLRITIGSKEQNQRLIETLENIRSRTSAF